MKILKPCLRLELKLMNKITVKYTFEDSGEFYGTHTVPKSWNCDMESTADTELECAIQNIADDFNKIKINALEETLENHDYSWICNWYKGYYQCLKTIKIISVDIEPDVCFSSNDNYTQVSAREAGKWMLDNVDKEIICQNNDDPSSHWRQKYGLYQEEFIDPEFWTYKFLVKFQGDDWERDNDPLQDNLKYFIPNRIQMDGGE